MTRKSKGARLREVFRSKQTELMPFGVLPIHAQMAQRAGFKAFHISGAMASWWLTGAPDVGMMTRTEVIDNARRVARCVDIPVYCDADTGFGGVQNVRRTVEEFIDAGIAGIHIEDQLDPKKAGGQAGIALVSDEEAIGRLNAAIEVRDAIDKDFVITARTDGYGGSGGGLDEAIRRGRLYRQHTSADVIFFRGHPFLGRDRHCACRGRRTDLCNRQQTCRAITDAPRTDPHGPEHRNRAVPPSGRSRCMETVAAGA